MVIDDVKAEDKVNSIFHFYSLLHLFLFTPPVYLYLSFSYIKKKIYCYFLYFIFNMNYLFFESFLKNLKYISINIDIMFKY